MSRSINIFLLVLLTNLGLASAISADLKFKANVTCFSSSVWKYEWKQWVEFQKRKELENVRKLMLKKFVRHDSTNDLRRTN